MARKDSFLKILDHKMPDRFIQLDDHYMAFAPGERNIGGEIKDGAIIGYDWFGCTWKELGKGPLDGAMLVPGQEPLDDISKFKEAGCIPSVDKVYSFDWEGYSKEVLGHLDRSEQILEVRSLNGFFERLHSLIGFENALCSFYEDPDAVHEFFSEMLMYKKAVVDCVKQYMNPDIMIFDDDYGTSRSTFMDPEMWREFFPGYWKELINYVHSKGMKAELHSCGYITPLVGDFVDIGFDILQPLQTNNNLREIKEKWGNKIILGLHIFDKQLDALGQTEDEVRADIRSYYETLAPGGMFLSVLVPGLHDRYYEIQAEVQNDFEKEFFKK